MAELLSRKRGPAWGGRQERMTGECMKLKSCNEIHILYAY